MEPTAIPHTIPTYIPISFHPKTNPNSHANTISRINALKIVNIKAIVPFPILWNRFPAIIPKGIASKKKHRIRIASVILKDRISLLAEYANICDKGSAKIKQIAQIMMEDIKPSLTP